MCRESWYKITHRHHPSQAVLPGWKPTSMRLAAAMLGARGAARRRPAASSSSRVILIDAAMLTSANRVEGQRNTSSRFGEPNERQTMKPGVSLQIGSANMTAQTFTQTHDNLCPTLTRNPASNWPAAKHLITTMPKHVRAALNTDCLPARRLLSGGVTGRHTSSQGGCVGRCFHLLRGLNRRGLRA